MILLKSSIAFAFIFTSAQGSGVPRAFSLSSFQSTSHGVCPPVSRGLSPCEPVTAELHRQYHQFEGPNLQLLW